MTDSEQPQQPQQPPPTERAEPGRQQSAEHAEPEWQRKRRLARIFGDVLPDTTDDERDPGERAERRESASERWLRSQVPPHHGQ